ncbi:MAG: S8 family serine peptidase [Clostridia bacterium]|nr:S8 family serine peptidase [Clostridia bacterium]
MSFKKIICLMLSLVLIAISVPISASAENSAESARYIDGEVVFRYKKPESSTKSYSLKARSAAAQSVESYFTDTLSYLGITEIEQNTIYSSSITLSSDENESAVYIAKISGDVESTCEQLEKIDGVSYAEPNYIYETDTFTMPGEISGSIYLNNMEWYHSDIMRFPEAWETYETAGEGVVVAVIDNGFNLSATDFPVNLWDDGNGNHGWNTYDNSNDISPVYMDDGTLTSDGDHGSNVAGVIGMSANGKNGIGGAYGAELMLIKTAGYLPILDSDGNVTKKCTITAASLASAISYAVANGADIINMSLGTTAYASVIKEQIDAAYNAGCVLIAAAGNYAYATTDAKFYPAAADNVIGVMASDKTDKTQLSSFSNYNTDTDKNYYDVAAPGVSIIGCAVTEKQLTIISGTSQASPLVACCAALYMSYYPEASNVKVYEAIRNASTSTVTSNKTVTSGEYSYPLLDAVSLLSYKPSVPELTAVGANITIDSRNLRIYGFDFGYQNLSDYIAVSNGTINFVPTECGNGTGSSIEIYDDYGDLYKTYCVIIFGDINGDCVADGQDSVEAACAVEWPDAYTDNQKYAADVDKSGSLDSDDVDIISNYALSLDFIDQV